MVTVPLILLAIPSVLAGYFVGPLLFGDFFAEALYVDESRDVLAMLGEGYHGVLGHMVHGVMMPPFWLAMAGLGTAWFVYMKRPDLAQRARDTLPWAYNILDRKYGFDEFNDAVFAGGARRLGEWLWRFGDTLLIDTVIVNGSARAVGWVSGRLRLGQTGYLYHYAFAMIIGLLVLILAFAL